MATTSLISHFNGKMTCPKYLRQPPSARHRPTAIVAVLAQTQNQSYLTSIDSDVETYLKKAIPIKEPNSVFEPMRHLTFAAPRTTASALCVAACELVGGDRSQAMAAAAVIHLMHAAAYTHEHLPLTDSHNPKSTLIQHKFKPNIELLIGDSIIPFGLQLLAKSSTDIPQNKNPERMHRVIIEITRAIGAQGMVAGKYHELEVALYQASAVGAHEYICKKKEGNIHACGAACGAILGGGAEDDIERLRKFGLYVGMVRGLMGKNCNKPGIEERLEDFKGLALKELESFHGDKIDLISSLIDLIDSRVVYAP